MGIAIVDFFVCAFRIQRFPFLYIRVNIRGVQAACPRKCREIRYLIIAFNCPESFLIRIDIPDHQKSRNLCNIRNAAADRIHKTACHQGKRKESAIMKGFKSGFYKIINMLSEVELHADASDFRTFTRGVADAILEMSEYHRFSKGIFSWIGFNTKFIPYEVQERNAGETKWSFRKLVKYAFSGISAFSTKPLSIATYIGGVATFASLVYLVVVIIQRIFFNQAFSGYATIVVLILFFGGLQLFCIGIIGSYLAKTYIQSKNRPIYIAKEILKRDK